MRQPLFDSNYESAEKHPKMAVFYRFKLLARFRLLPQQRGNQSGLWPMGSSRAYRGIYVSCATLHYLYRSVKNLFILV